MMNCDKLQNKYNIGLFANIALSRKHLHMSFVRLNLNLNLNLEVTIFYLVNIKFITLSHPH